MDLHLKGRTIAVAAASKGLGRAVAEALAREGANLSLCSRREEDIQNTAEALRQFGIEAEGMAVDVGNASAIEAWVEWTINRFGRVDGLLCNAGGPPGGNFLELSDQAWESAFQNNLMSVIRLIRGFYPQLGKNGGRVVTIASSSVKVPIPGLILSNTFRSGLAGLMKSLASELAPDGILLNTVCPGRIRTDRLQELDETKAARTGGSIEDIRLEAIREIPLGRYGEPVEFADLCAFLLSPRNSYMTGSSFFVDGGMVKAL